MLLFTWCPAEKHTGNRKAPCNCICSCCVPDALRGRDKRMDTMQPRWPKGMPLWCHMQANQHRTIGLRKERFCFRFAHLPMSVLGMPQLDEPRSRLWRRWQVMYNADVCWRVQFDEFDGSKYLKMIPGRNWRHGNGISVFYFIAIKTTSGMISDQSVWWGKNWSLLHQKCCYDTVSWFTDLVVLFQMDWNCLNHLTPIIVQNKDKKRNSIDADCFNRSPDFYVACFACENGSTAESLSSLSQSTQPARKCSNSS